MKERVRLYIDTFLFEYCVPHRVQGLLPRTAILYIFFGIIATSVDLTVFYFAGKWLAPDYILPATIAFLFSSTTNFVTNKYLNYQNKSEKLALQYGVHFMVGLTALFWTYLFLYFFIDILGLHRMVAKVITAFIMAFYAYMVHTKVTFGHTHFSQ